MRMTRFLLISFFVTFSVQTSTACGFSAWGEDYRYHLMFPESLGKGPIMPFHFSSAYWYSHPFEFEELGIQKNSKEWASADGYRHSPKVWERALYEISYSVIVASEDTFVQHFLQSTRKEVRATYLYVKKIEGLYEDYSPWVSDNRVTEPNKAMLLEEGKRLYDETHSKQLRCRIAFQLIRLAPDSIFMEVVEAYLNPVRSNSITGVWALRQIAGYHTRQGNDAQANVLFAQLFVQADEWKYWAYENYTRGILIESLEKAENPDDKEVLRVLDALRTPTKGLEKLKSLYTMNSGNPLIDMLLLREINKMEDLLFTPKFTKNAPAVYGWYNSDKLPEDIENRLYAKQLREFVWKEASGIKSRNSFWNLAAGYLAMLDNQSVLADRFLQKSKTCSDFSPGIEIQWLTLKALYLAKDKNISREGRREKVAEAFLNLKAKLGTEKKASSVLSNLALFLANTFHESGDQVMAAYCFAYTQHYTDRFWFFYTSDWSNSEWGWYDEDQYFGDNWAGSMQFFFYLEKEAPTQVIIDVSKQLKNKELSGALSEFMEPVRANLYRVYDLLGTRYFVEKNYRASLQAFNKIPDIWWDTCIWEVYKEIPREPFKSPIEYIRSPLTEWSYLKMSNKCIIADSMFRWTKTQAKLKGNEAAVYQFKIANLLLNTTYGGGAWAMTRYWRSSQDERGEYGYVYQKGIEEKLDMDYFDYDLAKSWYLKAYQSSSDPLMRASCLARAAWCEDDSPFYFDNAEDGKRGARFNRLAPSLQKLLKEYPDMAASVYSGCPGFDAFFARR